MKKCSTCHKEQPEASYHKNRASKDGLERRCKSCRKKAAALKYKDSWFEQTVKLKRSYCRKHNLPFNIDAEYLKNIWTEHCPITGNQFKKGDKKSDDCPNLDRYVPSKGYVKGNLCYISARMNRIKDNSNAEELINLANYITNKETH